MLTPYNNRYFKKDYEAYHRQIASDGLKTVDDMNETRRTALSYSIKTRQQLQFIEGIDESENAVDLMRFSRFDFVHRKICDRFNDLNFRVVTGYHAAIDMGNLVKYFD